METSSKPLKISIITSCYNSGPFIEDTVRSVIQQRYPALEYIVIDGASTDNSLEIVNRYADDIHTIISEPDKGQYHGIQKGFDLATGDIMAWLNADDIYYPWTLAVVNEIFTKFPEVDWISGIPTFMNKYGQCTKVVGNPAPSFPNKFIRNGWFRSPYGGWLQQESMFWRRSLMEKTGGLNLDLRIAADYELWTRFAQHANLVGVSSPLACFRERPGEQRSSAEGDAYMKEVLQVASQWKDPSFLWRGIAERGLAWRWLCRMLIWRHSEVVAFSNKHQEWKKKRLRMPISKASITELLLERALSR